VAAEPEALTRFLCDKIREKILAAQTGLTGANFVTASGQVVLLENEGNISLISRLPKKHIVVCGIDKLVSSVEAATELSRAAALFGTGQESTQYVSVISGPSKTADIENHLALGAQGTREVHIILLDNGRRELLKEGLGAVPRCIGCGNCLNVCPVYQQKGRDYRGWDYIGSRGIVMEEFSRASEELKKTPRGESLFDCTLCGRCYANCPMQINLPGLVRKIRQRADGAGKQSKANQEMLDKVKKTGNPFGGERRETSGELFCC